MMHGLDFSYRMETTVVQNLRNLRSSGTLIPPNCRNRSLAQAPKAECASDPVPFHEQMKMRTDFGGKIWQEMCQ